MYTSTVTTKGQATIPAPIRKKLGLKPGEKLIFEENNQSVVIKAQKQLIDELYGSLKPKIKVKYSDKKADRAVEEFVVKEYLNSHGKVS